MGINLKKPMPAKPAAPPEGLHAVVPTHVPPVTAVAIRDEIMERKQQFEALFRSKVKRPGVDALLSWLETTDFYVAPASTNYHGGWRGGLCAHSLEVYKWLCRLAPVFFGDSINESDEESMVVAALCHDFCKIGFYAQEQKWRKTDNKWESYLAYVVKDEHPIGHGEKSVIFTLQTGFALTREEMLAINWHMNFSDDRSSTYGGGKSLQQAKRECHLLIVLSMADEAASYISDI